MGVDVHGLNFLRLAHRFGGFGDTCMIGRQNLHVSRAQLCDALGADSQPLFDRYAEDLLLGAFGATSVDSIDYSDYEQATLIHDMNRPIGPALEERFDTILDFGTLEHVYELPTALKNLSRMVRVGGQILHVLPANNMSGHGFWQMSPELFFSLYAPRNGYRDTVVCLAELNDPRHWLMVSPPANGRRINFRNRSETYVMVRTVRAGPVSHEVVLQSDYVASWTENTQHTAGMSVTRRLGFLSRLKRSLMKRLVPTATSPLLTRLSVEEAIAAGGPANVRDSGVGAASTDAKNVA